MIARDECVTGKSKLILWHLLRVCMVILKKSLPIATKTSVSSLMEAVLPFTETRFKCGLHFIRKFREYLVT